jgi:hypothetical protein
MRPLADAICFPRVGELTKQALYFVRTLSGFRRGVFAELDLVLDLDLDSPQWS